MARRSSLALTAQNTQGVSAIHTVPADFVTAQLDAVFSDLDVRAVKIGMVAQRDVIAAIVGGLSRWSPPHVVVDPVMIATSGKRLLAPDAMAMLRGELIPRAQLITPNLPEAAALLGTAIAETAAEIERQGHQLLALGCSAVLIKGGHGTGASSVDYLIASDGTVGLTAPRVAPPTPTAPVVRCRRRLPRGLAKGDDLRTAVHRAKDYISAAIAAADQLQVGRGHGPVHHFHAFESGGGGSADKPTPTEP